MNILNGADLAYIATHYEAIYREWNTQIYFCFDSKESGETAMGILTRLLSAQCNYEHYGIDKRDFYLGFNSRAIADQVCENIKASIAEYYKVDPATVNYVPQSAVDTKPEDDVKKPGNTVTYIVIGAAIVAILLLLWDKKRK